MNFEKEELQDIYTKSLGNVNAGFVDTQVLMYRFLAEVEKITDEREISRRQLAKLLGTSASYITQIFQGNKVINLDLLARIQRALDIKFEITAIPNYDQSCEKVKHAFMFERPANKSVNRQKLIVRSLYDTPYDVMYGKSKKRKSSNMESISA